MSVATLPGLLRQAAAQHSDRPAIVFEGRMLTYTELDAAAARMANSLIRHGVEPGDRVALWLPKSIEAFLAVWGVALAGAVYVPIDPTAPAARAATIIRDCDATGLVTVSGYYDSLARSADGPLPLRAVWCANAASSQSTIAGLAPIPWNEVVGESRLRPDVEVSGEDLASIPYTSGSTGMPKGVMVSHQALLEQALWTQEFLRLSPADRLPGYSPLHSGMAAFELFVGACAGAATYPVPSRLAAFPAHVVRSWSDQRLTVWFVVPSALAMMLANCDLSALDLSSLKTVIFTGEKFPLARLHDLMTLLPNVTFVNSYSCTEAKIRALRTISYPPQAADTRLIGKTSASARLSVLDDHGRPVADGEVGKVWVSGPVVMRGYWNLPELTAKALRNIELSPAETVTAYCTGDLARRNEDGAIELVGRADQQVKIRGFRVEIGEIEAVLERHAAVAQTVVLMAPDRAQGEVLKAIVVLHEGASATASELRRHCAELLPPYMVPVTVEFRAALPLMSTGKIDRRQLQAPPQLASKQESTKPELGRETDAKRVS